MRELQALFFNNQQWVESKLKQDVTYFTRRAKEHDPLYLWIGCSDSRVPANEIVGLEPGELFVHRNVGNLCLHTDFNCLSVIEFAVAILSIKHIIVCGHYGCGAIQEAMENNHLGLVDNWLRNIRDIYANSQEVLKDFADLEVRSQRLVELNVFQQVMNICHTTIVQNAWARKQSLSVHGWVYDMETGKLKDLNCCFSSIEQIGEIYRLAPPFSKGL